MIRKPGFRHTRPPQALALTAKSYSFAAGFKFLHANSIPPHSAAGYIRRGVPIYCGGELLSTNHVGGRLVYSGRVRLGGCYAFSAFLTMWVVMGKLPMPKAYHAASSHPDLGLVLTGGWDNKNYASVETTKDGVNFDRSMPDMPETKSGHCQVTTDKKTIMVFGGCEKNCHMASSFMLDVDAKKWTKLPDMPRGRHRLSCEVVKEGGMAIQVITVGGFYERELSNAVDIFDLSTLKWKKGKNWN